KGLWVFLGLGQGGFARVIQQDSRTRSTAKRRGIEITSISRPTRPSDFRDFDLILAMDKSNRVDISEALDRRKQRDNLPHDADKKINYFYS
ncbi:Low molecular weight phosphotyrosine protein phosphatase, partial [Bienertia sinuspersici]